MSRNTARGQSGRGILGRGTGRTVNDGRLDLFWWLTSGAVFFDTADCGAVYNGDEYISTKDVAHALEIRSALVECDMMP